MDTQDLVKELRSGTCACGAGKNAMQSFCLDCYIALPGPARRGLYSLIGDGYAEARATAIGILRKKGRVT